MDRFCPQMVSNQFYFIQVHSFPYFYVKKFKIIERIPQ